jgi:hypothetical protein
MKTLGAGRQGVNAKTGVGAATMGSMCDVRLELRRKGENPFHECSDPVNSYVRRIPVCMYARLLTVLTFALVVSTMAATTNGVTFNVRQENGVDQYYRLEVPPNLPPAKPDTGKISQNEVPIIAVGWAAGLEN